jgi:ABC-2 type transport system permease protein
MFKELRFALYAIKKNIQSSAELRSSFLLNIVGMAINNSSFIILWSFFVKSVGEINGWSVADVIALQGFTALTFGLVFSTATGLRSLPEYVASGDFDRFMLSPKNLLLRIATATFSPSAIGDVIFGLICLAFYAFLIHMGIGQILFMALMVIVATGAFLATTIAVFSTSFLFTDSGPVTHGLFELFLTPAIFHGGAFQGSLRFVFTFIVPSLLVGGLPVEAVRDLDWSKAGLIILLTLVWFWFALFLFKRAVRKYESANFINFNSN